MSPATPESLALLAAAGDPRRDPLRALAAARAEARGRSPRRARPVPGDRIAGALVDVRRLRIARGTAAVFTLPPLALSEALPRASIADTDRFLWRSGFPELWARPELDRDLWLASDVATYLERDVAECCKSGSCALSIAFCARGSFCPTPNWHEMWASRQHGEALVFGARGNRTGFPARALHRPRRKRLIKAPQLYFADTGLLVFLQGFRNRENLPAHALWGAVWGNLVVTEVRKRLFASARPPALWFWRTAHGEEVDLLVETAPERFVAIEAKAAERVTGAAALAAECGARAIQALRAACRSKESHPLEATGPARAVSLGGPRGCSPRSEGSTSARPERICGAAVKAGNPRRPMRHRRVLTRCPADFSCKAVSEPAQRAACAHALPWTRALRGKLFRRGAPQGGLFPLATASLWRSRPAPRTSFSNTLRVCAFESIGKIVPGARRRRCASP